MGFFYVMRFFFLPAGTVLRIADEVFINCPNALGRGICFWARSIGTKRTPKIIWICCWMEENFKCRRCWFLVHPPSQIIPSKFCGWSISVPFSAFPRFPMADRSMIWQNQLWMRLMILVSTIFLIFLQMIEAFRILIMLNQKSNNSFCRSEEVWPHFVDEKKKMEIAFSPSNEQTLGPPVMISHDLHNLQLKQFCINLKFWLIQMNTTSH